MKKFYQFLLILFSTHIVIGQVMPESKDSTKTGFSVGKIDLKKQKSIQSSYTYNPLKDVYVYTDSQDGSTNKHPPFLTPKEYKSLVLKESMREYFKSKADAIEGKKEVSEEVIKDLLPKYYVNSNFFKTIFGSNDIDFKPTGSVEGSLGIRYTQQDNPALSPVNRSNTTLDFNQRITFGIIGKVGTRLNLNLNYDTQATFSFQNLIKISYSPGADDPITNTIAKTTAAAGAAASMANGGLASTLGKVPAYNANEDSIIQAIEVGNVSMPLNSTLIKGTQSLFGVKTKLQFGKTTFTGVFSEQKSKTKSIIAEGGGTVQNFDLFALDYDNDRHFFLSQFFRNRYDTALKKYPFIDSRIQIMRLEVWVTNKQNRVTTTNNNIRNIIALQDLGEAQLSGLSDSEVVALDPSAGIFNKPADSPADNSNNKYDPSQIKAGTGLLNSNIREIVTSQNGFNVRVTEGQDYSKLENARKLNPNEYSFHPQLGYLSLQQRLTNDEVLAVAYQYSIGDKIYQVGEFGNDGVDATVVTGNSPSNQAVITQNLILKMLKSNLTNVKKPIWNLMMKNIYQIPGAYQLKQEDFRFNILYADPSPLNYIKPVSGTTFPLSPTIEDKVAETPLLRVFNLDKLNYNNDPQAGGDGFFDFIPSLTIDAQNGRIIFTSKEPFGELLFSKLSNPNSGEDYRDINTYNDNQKKYVFRNMYRNTAAGALQDAEKNKFLLRGKYKSSIGEGIPIGAFNVPQGSVKVTAAGRVLVEGIDYSVNYQLGRVQILDPSLQASNIPIQVSVENNSVFGQQIRTFIGVNVEHKFSDKFLVGGTYLKLNERPLTQKSNLGQESVNNTIFGFNTSFSSEVPFLTRLVNKLPNIDTDVPSNLSVRGEVAFLRPDAPTASKFEGQSTLYIDSFEGSQSTIDMRGANAWSLSSTPVNDLESTYNFGESATDLSYGFKRAKLAWYSIDPIFYTQKPSGISNEDLSLNATRRVYSKELYPFTDIVQGQTQVVNTLDLSYYPSERGPYNNNPNVAVNPKDNFGGIIRPINSTNFEQGNVEYIQFWVLDPYVGTGVASASNTGKIYFNLGEISEDILKDGRKQYENGLGPDQIVTKPSSIWGNVPASQSLIYTFDTNPSNRTNQDIGLDGLDNGTEGSKYTNFASESDPAADDYKYYLNTSGDLLTRYKNYNGVDGNSAVDINSSNRAATTLPDVEDINRDNTMNTINAYYEYDVDIKPNMNIGENYITDIRNSQVELPDGTTTTSRWLQFKIPVSQPKNTIGDISDFRSIRFMRMFMTGFANPITVRFGSLDLVRGDWRRYSNTLDAKDTNVEDDRTSLDVLTVNVLQNSERCPINYVSPPNVVREQLYSNNTVINQDEQSLSLRVSEDGLEPGDSRAVFKNVSVDMRQFKRLKMFLHAESLPTGSAIRDNQMVGFIRFGNDVTQNFYQVEIPLKVTLPSSASSSSCTPLRAELVWPEENQIDLALDLLTKLKIQAMGIDRSTLPLDGIYYKSESDLDPTLASKPNKLRLGIKGNPNFGLVRVLMVGVKSNESSGRVKGEVWFNELRMADMESKGGMAAVLNIDSNMADFATISATGKKSTIGFGSIEQVSNERSREDLQQYNIVTNWNLGKLLPKKWGITLPFNYAVGEEVITPEYDPFNLDIKLDQLLSNTQDVAKKDEFRNRAIDYTRRTSINFIGVRKERGANKKPHIYDIENLTFSQSINEVQRHDFEIVDYSDQKVSTLADYAYTFKSKPIEFFKNTAFMKKSNYWKLLREINFNYLPSNISFNTNIIRQYNRQKYRQADDVQGIGLDALYRRNYMFNYQYGFGYNLSKSLKITYSASSGNIVKNYLNPDNTTKDGLNIWDDYWNIGEPNRHTQQIVANYELPINKIPLFEFVKSNYSYTADYSWQKSSEALSKIEIDKVTYNLGNTIQNASSHNLNTVFTMDNFYRYIGLTKTKNTQRPKISTNIVPKPGEKITKGQEVESNERNIFARRLIGFLTSVRSIQVNLTENSGTVLPGYVPGVGFFGTSKPTLGFVFGSQDDVRYEAARNGWLTNYPNFNQNFTRVNNKIFKAIANVDLLPDFKIDISLDRSYSENSSEQYDVTDGQYNSRSPYTTGIFSVSTLMIGTAFMNSDESGSEAFNKFRQNRLIIANRLASQRGIDITNPANISPEGFPLGYGKNNQAVLIPAFLAAYSGSSANDSSLGIFKNIPLPNWAIKYTGLMKIQFFKDNFKRFSIQHNYKSSYTINSFRSNIDYDKNPSGVDKSGNFLNPIIMSNVNLIEQFSPLIRVDVELNNAMRFLTEIKKDRALSMSFDNNLLTEVQGIEYIGGLGYRFKNVAFYSKLANNASGEIKGDINLRLDLSYRSNKTIVRYLDYDNNRIAAGQNLWTIKLAADYSLSKNLNAIFYYDHSFSNSYVSSSFPLTTIRSGLTLRYTFGN